MFGSSTTKSRNGAYCSEHAVDICAEWSLIYNPETTADVWSVARTRSSLTSPYASGRYRGQNRERGGYDLCGRRHRFGVVPAAAAAAAAHRAGPDLRRLHEPVLGRDPRTVLL